MFKINDRVYCDYYKQSGTVISTDNGNSTFHIQVHFDNGTRDTYTRDGRINISGKPSLRIFKTSITTDQYSITSIGYIAQLITLADGTRIYHPASGQPFQLTTKESLC